MVLVTLSWKYAFAISIAGAVQYRTALEYVINAKILHIEVNRDSTFAKTCVLVPRITSENIKIKDEYRPQLGIYYNGWQPAPFDPDIFWAYVDVFQGSQA